MASYVILRMVVEVPKEQFYSQVTSIYNSNRTGSFLRFNWHRHIDQEDAVPGESAKVETNVKPGQNLKSYATAIMEKKKGRN